MTRFPSKNILAKLHLVLYLIKIQTSLSYPTQNPSCLFKSTKTNCINGKVVLGSNSKCCPKIIDFGKSDLGSKTEKPPRNQVHLQILTTTSLDKINAEADNMVEAIECKHNQMMSRIKLGECTLIFMQ